MTTARRPTIGTATAVAFIILALACSEVTPTPDSNRHANSYTYSKPYPGSDANLPAGPNTPNPRR